MATVSINAVKLKEILYILRHRLRFSQDQMSFLIGRNRTALSKMERGVWETHLPIEFLDIELTDVEICVLLRRRKQLNHTQLADIMEVTRTWVSHMETGGSNPTRLIEYWSS